MSEKGQKKRNLVLIEVNGANDFETFTSLMEKMGKLKTQGCSEFVLDMTNMNYVSSTSLGKFIKDSDTLKKEGIEISVVLNQKYQVVFEMLGLSTFFEIFQTKKDALDYFAQDSFFSKYWIG